MSPADGHGPALERKLKQSLEPRSGPRPNLPGFDSPDFAALSEDQTKVLEEEVIPYWKGRGRYEKTLGGRNYQQVPDELRDLFFVDPQEYPPRTTKVAPGCLNGQHYGHNIIGFDKVLEKGFLGLKMEAEERLAGLDTTRPEDASKIPFLEGVITVLSAAAELGARYSALARQKAEDENDPVRKSELLQIARGSSGGPAVTLKDARSAAPIGCSELGIPGKDSGYLHYGGPNLAAAMELVLANGYSRSDKKESVWKPGIPDSLKHLKKYEMLTASRLPGSEEIVK